MWDVEDDLLKIGQKCIDCTHGYREGPDPGGVPIKCKPCGGTGTINQSRDTCCNLSVVFEIERIYDRDTVGIGEGYESVLNMTVYNRSNDMILGALGANQVHFSILLEYMAAHIGVEVGTYYQVSSNMHVYTDPKLWQPEKWLADQSEDYRGSIKPGNPRHASIEMMGWEPFPLVKDPATFDKEVMEFVERHGKDAVAHEYSEPFLEKVAQPMCIAFHHHKHREYGRALSTIMNVAADDWRIAGTNWLKQRAEGYKKKLISDYGDE